MRYFLIIFILTASLSSFSQKKNFNGGLIFGLTSSQVDGDTYGGFHKTGISFGAFVETQLDKKQAVQFELRFIQKGSRKPVNLKKEDYVYYMIHLDYIEVPVVYSYSYDKKTTLQCGGYLGYLINSYEELIDNGYDYGDISQVNPFNKVEFGALIGVDYKLNKHLYINARASYSITPIRAHTLGRRWWLKYGQFNNILNLSLYYKI